MCNFVVSIRSADGLALTHMEAQWWPSFSYCICIKILYRYSKKKFSSTQLITLSQINHIYSQIGWLQLKSQVNVKIKTTKNRFL